MLSPGCITYVPFDAQWHIERAKINMVKGWVPKSYQNVSSFPMSEGDLGQGSRFCQE